MTAKPPAKHRRSPRRSAKPDAAPVRIPSVAEARARLPELLRLVEGGREVVVCRRGKAVARMTKAEDG